MASGSVPVMGLRPVKFSWSVMMQKSPTRQPSLMAPAALVVMSMSAPSAAISHTGKATSWAV